jgi:hypothetical protein
MPGESSGGHLSICRRSSDGVTNRRPLNQEMWIVVGERQDWKPGHLRSECNSLKPLVPGTKVFSDDKKTGGSRSLRFLPSNGKRSSVGKKIDILFQKRTRSTDLEAMSRGT